MRNLLIGAVVFGLLSTAIVRADDTESLGPNSRIPYSSLSSEEREILARGEISTGAYVAGGVVGTIVGLGIGNAIQGRYMPYGLVFTLGEIGSAALYSWGANDCIEQTFNGIFTNTTVNCHNGALVIGTIGLVGFRIWEIVDNWASPPAHNDRYRDLKRRVDGAPTAEMHWVLLPALVQERGNVRGIDGATFAMQLRF